MRRMFVVLLVVLAGSGVLSGCGDDLDEERTLRRYSDPAEVIDVRAASSFAIELPAEDATWEVTRAPDDAVARIVSETDVEARSDDVEAVDTWLLELEAEDAGETTIALSQGGEDGEKEVLEFTIEVHR